MRFKKNLLAIMNEYSSEGLQHTLRKCSIVTSPQFRPPCSCTIFLPQSQVFHLPSPSSRPNRLYGLCTLSFNPHPKIPLFCLHLGWLTFVCSHCTLFERCCTPLRLHCLSQEPEAKEAAPPQMPSSL